MNGPAKSDLSVTRLVTGFAAGISLLLALAGPAAYFLAARSREAAKAQAHGEDVAQRVSELVARNPDFWQFEQARIAAILTSTGVDHAGYHRRVIDLGGRVLAADPDAITGPSLEVADPVFDSGRVVAEVRTTRSLLPAMAETGKVALVSGVLGLAAFLALRILPMRVLTRALARAAHLAHYDTLTGLPNRTLFQERLRQALALGSRERHTVAVLCLDLDHFKDVNDTLGHAAGDTLLVQVAERLTSNLRETDCVARLGGDEFAIVQLSARQPQDVEALAKRLVAHLAEPFDLGGHRATIGTSIGISLHTVPHNDPGRLLREADLALYQSKGEGRGSFSFFEPRMNERLLERKRLEEDLRDAIGEGQFLLHYQPLVEFDASDAATRLVGAEALIRWQHPSRGDVRPDQFIPVAETTGLIVPIGAWVLREACQEAARWPEHLSVAVNVSPVQLRQGQLVETVKAALRDSGLPPSRLEIEVTEGVLLADTETVLVTLKRLRDLGVRISMDDFGTGYSSLGYLRRFRFDKIKIDASFVRNIGADTEANAIVRAVLGMGHALGVKVNAEGVETARQLALLQLEGCDEVQGYLFGRPMPAEEFELAMARNAASLVTQ
jgi:diguanylate cyclase (GGDEF)-like protein